MIKSIQNNIAQLSLTVLAALILIFLFIKAQPIDPVVHNRVLSDIRELEKRDTELGETVLQLHYRMVNNYDEVVSLLQDMQFLAANLKQYHQNDLLMDTPAIRKELDALDLQLEQKAKALDNFKSYNAVMKNSFIYLPRMVDEVLQKLPRSNEPLLEKFEFLLRDALMMSVNSNTLSRNTLQQAILRVDQAVPTLPEQARLTARYASQHAKMILDSELNMGQVLAMLSATDRTHLGDRLEQLYQDGYEKEQRTASVYRLFLFLAAMLMLAYAGYLFYKAKEKGLKLAQALAEIKNQQLALDEHAIVSITDVKGDIIYMNPKFIEISGYAPEELLGKNHRVINSGHHSEEFFRELWQTVARGKVWHGQVKNRAKDGSEYWVEATVVPFMNEDGKPYQYVSVRTDITAQKAMEDQVLHERRMLQNVMDTLGEGVYMLDKEGRCTYLNQEAEAIIGWNFDELRGKKLHNVIHSHMPDGSTVAEEDCPVHLCMKTARIYRSENDYFQNKNGTIFPIAIVASPMLEDGEVIGSVAAFQDISERKQHEEQLRQSDIRQRMLLDNAADAVLITQLDERWDYANDHALALLGYSREELIGQSIYDLVPPSYQEIYKQAFQKELLREGKMFREVRFIHKDGRRLDLEMNAAVLPDESIYVSCRDISMRKEHEAALIRAKEAAEAASKAKGDFLATMSHEIRTPMNGIIGMTELALDTELNSDQREYLGLVKSSADSLLGIINDILDFSKIESGKMEIERVEFDIRSVIVGTQKMLAMRAGEKGLELVNDIDSEIPDNLLGDPGRLRQVLTNLIGNAIKFSQHGEVAVRMKLLSRSENIVRARIEVADQGIGIPANKLDHIFEAFTQADTSTTRKYGGTGLGLAISSQLVAAMGAQLKVTSEVGQGSVFSFDIDFPIGHTIFESPSLVNLAGVTVLAVDDNATNLRLLDKLLHKWGMSPTLVESATAAIAAVTAANEAGKPFQLILLDAMMPEMDGFELAAALKTLPEPPIAAVMMLSSAGLRGDAKQCQELGITAYMTKPVEQGELLEAIKVALNHDDRAGLVTRHSIKERQQQAKLNILLAEDNLVNQKLAVTLLEKWGHRVEVANNGVEAVAKSERGDYDVILMDLQMPEMGGIEATQLIRQRENSLGKHTKMVAMTANAMSEDKQRCLDAGMDDYISKPLNTEKLRALLSGISQHEEVATALSPAIDVPPAFDYMAALKRADEWVVETIGQAFLDESAGQMAEIDGALRAQDAKLLLRSAHTLRGLVGNFNALRVEEIARQIENSAEKNQLAEAAEAHKQLVIEVDLLNAALTQHLENLSKV